VSLQKLPFQSRSSGFSSFIWNFWEIRYNECNNRYRNTSQKSKIRFFFDKHEFLSWFLKLKSCFINFPVFRRRHANMPWHVSIDEVTMSIKFNFILLMPLCTLVVLFYYLINITILLEFHFHFILETCQQLCWCSLLMFMYENFKR
jgi:hypothetical protein